MCAKLGLRLPVGEYYFAKTLESKSLGITRQHRSDYAWVEEKIAIEIDGGVHRIHDKWQGDIEKNNIYAILGWRVLHFTPDMINKPITFPTYEWVKALVGNEVNLV